MKKLTQLEKKEHLGGAAKRKPSASSSTSRKLTLYNTKAHNWSLLSLAVIPGLISLGEELYSLLNKSNSYYAGTPRRKPFGFAGGGSPDFLDEPESLMNRRDFYAYASEAFRPMIRFSPYYSKSGITFGMPWLK